jgi:hypothetical protein
MIQFEQGCVYDVAHLKPFDLQLALSGHPLAAKGGEAVRFCRNMNHNMTYWDCWIDELNLWRVDWDFTHCVSSKLRLAPLGVKDGRALHVGDEIEMGRSLDCWDKTIITSFQEGMALANADECGQWPKE